MKRSEIFASFVKIAQEKGLISNDSSEAKKQLEKTHRADSMDISAIEALYGVKPDAPKGMDYKSNIMEVAHPNSVIVSPSYDKLNGLVENNQERQNILLNIVNKPVNGHLTQHKYAEKELILSLVRIGNDLDNKGQAELATLADYCLTEVTDSTMKKTAQDPVTLTIGAIAVALGGLYLKNHMRFISDGLEKDHSKLIGELDDILNSNKDWGVGTQYKQDFTNAMSQFKNKIESFYKLFKQIEPIINEVEKPRDAKELEEWSKTNDVGKVQKAIDAFQGATRFILPEVDKIIKNFADEQYKQRQTEDKGWMTSLVDATQILHGGKGLVADDFDDVRHALETYKLDIQNINKVLAETGSIKAKATSEMQASLSSGDSLLGSKPAENPSAPGAPKEQSIADIDDYASKLSKTLLG